MQQSGTRKLHQTQSQQERLQAATVLQSLLAAGNSRRFQHLHSSTAASCGGHDPARPAQAEHSQRVSHKLCSAWCLLQGRMGSP